MKNKILLAIFMIGFCCQLFAGGQKDKNASPWSKYPEFSGEGYITKQFTETPEAFPNPMKGFKSSYHLEDTIFRHHEYASIYRPYIRYTDLESSADDTVQKIIDWSNRAWAGIEKRNIKVNPRVILTYASSPETDGIVSGWHLQKNKQTVYREFWPSDIPQDGHISRWYSRELEDRLKNFIRKLGQAWDNDPRVAVVEIGLWGYWGEHNLSSDVPNFYDGIIPQSMYKALGDAFTESFKNKKAMIRYPQTFTNYSFGIVHDGFALPGDSDMSRMIRRNVWRDQMISGEIAYDHNTSLYGSSPDDTLRNNRYTNYIIDWINRANASSLSWISEYTQGDLSLRNNAARMQKAFGYRYVIRSAIYKEKANKGEEAKFGFEVTNVGSAPFYYNWPVEVSLLDQNRNVVFKKNLNVDIRTWLPNETKTIVDSITIPNNLRDGTYFIAVSILDPAGNLPSLRFANTNYFYGGRTPIGIIGINAEPQVDFGRFDLLRTDRSLQYTVGNNNPSNRTINSEQGIRASFDRWQTNNGNGSTINIRTGTETIDGNNFTVYTVNGNHVNGGYAHAITAGNAATVNNLKRMRAFSFTILGDGNDYRVGLQTSDTWSAAGKWDNYHTVIPTVKGEAINIIIFVDTLTRSGWNTPVPFVQGNTHSLQFEPANYKGVGQFEFKIWDIRTYQ